MEIATMRRLKHVFLASAVLAGSAGSALAADRLVVVASFSILGDLVANVGGEHVTVETLVGPDGDAHVFEPSPNDAALVAKADLVVVNGLNFEGWLDRLVEASGYSGPVAVASNGARLISPDGDAGGHDEASHNDDPPAGENGHEAHEEPGGHRDGHAGHQHEGDYDPHAWQSAENAMAYVGNIAEALCGADTANCSSYRANAAAYTESLHALDDAIKAGFASIPEERRKVITTHDAFAYFGAAYGIQFIAPQGVSTESEASAADVAALIEQIRDEGVTALFVENISDPRLVEQIGRETGVAPGGALYSDALSGPGGPAATYLEMMRHNSALLQAAMQGS